MQAGTKTARPYRLLIPPTEKGGLIYNRVDSLG